MNKHWVNVKRQVVRKSVDLLWANKEIIVFREKKKKTHVNTMPKAIWTSFFFLVSFNVILSIKFSIHSLIDLLTRTTIALDIFMENLLTDLLWFVGLL